MKKYIVEVTAKGGMWRGQRQKFAIGPVEASNKEEAQSKALDIAERELKGEDYDSLHAGKAHMAEHLPA